LLNDSIHREAIATSNSLYKHNLQRRTAIIWFFFESVEVWWLLFSVRTKTMIFR